MAKYYFHEATLPVEELLITPPGFLKAAPAQDAINAISGPLLDLEAFNSELMTLHVKHVGKRRRRGKPSLDDLEDTV